MSKKEKEIKDLIIENMDHVSLRDLKERIGYGYAGQLKKYIERETRKVYTEMHIRRSMCLKTMNPIIVAYAIEYANTLSESSKKNKKQLEEVKQFFHK